MCVCVQMNRLATEARSKTRCHAMVMGFVMMMIGSFLTRRNGSYFLYYIHSTSTSVGLLLGTSLGGGHRGRRKSLLVHLLSKYISVMDASSNQIWYSH